MKLTIEQIRSELKTLRTYYANHDQLDRMFRFIPHDVTELVKKYTEIIKHAPLELYMLYFELYINGSTQETAAEELNFCTEYVRKKNRQLLEFFQSESEDGR